MEKFYNIKNSEGELSVVSETVYNNLKQRKDETYTIVSDFIPPIVKDFDEEIKSKVTTEIPSTKKKNKSK